MRNSNSIEASIDRKTETISQLVRSLIDPQCNGILLLGPPGVGKSKLVSDKLKENNIPFVRMPLHSSPLANVVFIHKNSDKTILCDDDAENKHPINLAIQKALLGPDSDGLKTIRINTSPAVRKREGLPDGDVDFTGKFIFIRNATGLSSDLHSLALQSRIPHYHFDLDFEERMTVLKKMSKSPELYGLNPTQMDELMRFVDESVHPGVSNFDLRLLSKAAAIITGSPSDWKLGVASLISADPRFRILKQISKICDEYGLPVRERVRLFCQQTGQSRSTYFNLCQKFGFSNPYSYADIDLRNEIDLSLKPPNRGRATKNQSKNPAVSDPTHVEISNSQEDRHGVEVRNENQP